LFLPGPKCSDSCSGHTVYDPSTSSTSKDLQKPFSIRYGDGSTVSGEQYSDTVSIAGLAATGQTLGVATTFSTGFSKSQFPADGMMGMGFKGISTYNANPYFQSLVAEGKIVEPMFSFRFGAQDSELVLGGSDDSEFVGQMIQVKVDQEESAIEYAWFRGGY